MPGTYAEGGDYAEGENMIGSDLKHCIALSGLIVLALVYDGELLMITAGALLATLGIGIYTRVTR